MRIGFVVQRYGRDVAGGAEALCRDTARALAAAGEDVTVLTTTARDYIHWTPHYQAGEEDDEGVRVIRHANDTPDPARGARLAMGLRLAGATPESERAWAIAQGPVSHDLLRTLVAERFDAVAAWTYLYATSQLALPLVASRSILVPLAHEEPMLRYPLTRGLVRTARGLAFMTPEERALVQTVCPIGERPEAIVGSGVAAPTAPPGPAGIAGLPARYALCLGRIDSAKGIPGVIAAHARYRDAGGPLGLVLAGRQAADLDLPAWVTRTGFVDERTRDALIAGAEVVVLPSPYESLSLVALEAWRLGRPTLANAQSAVLAGQTARSGGGLLYTGERTYGGQLGRLAGDPDLRAKLGSTGREWVSHQTWDRCVERWRGLLHAVADARSAAA